MKITKTLVDKLIALCNGEHMPFSSLKGDWVHDLLNEGILVSTSHGSRLTLSVNDRASFSHALGRLDERLADLEQTRALLSAEPETSGPARARMASESGNSKLVTARSFPGFLVNSLEPVDCILNGLPFVVNPPEGSLDFICDWRHFAIPGDAVVVGIENAENFRFVRRQKALFEETLPGKRLLFVSRYPQSTDLRQWLMSIPNPYVHFGDLDLAGIGIYLNEFYKYLGKRASFLVPTDYESRISRGSALRYETQYRKFRRMKIADSRLLPLVECIHKHHKGYDQEGFITL